jgi:hypothetical protein
LNSKGFIPLLVDSCPGPPGAFTNGISVSHSKSILYGSFVWARRALNRPKWRFPARAVLLDPEHPRMENTTMTGTTSPGRHCHSTLPLAVIDDHSLGICILILLSLLSK